MNFFKSILSEDSDPPKPENPHDPESDSPLKRDQDPDNVGLDQEHSSQPPKNPNSDQSSDGSIGGGGWSFGGLIKTFATQSESVLETYRRDLREFGSGLRKETVIIREVASRAVKDLPASLEAGASAAHGSLESVGQALDGVLKSTADIISQGKESLISGSDGEPETPETNKSLSSGRYSRFDAQLNAIQTDVNTFSKDPEDLEKYKKWKSGFNLEEKNNELEGLIGENGVLESLYKRIVPSFVDENLSHVEKQEGSSNELRNKDEGDYSIVDNVDKNDAFDSSKKDSNNVFSDEKPKSKEIIEVKNDEKVESEKIAEEKNDDKVKSNETVDEDAKGEKNDAGKESAVSSHESAAEEDLEWDEIEDIESHDEKKVSTTHGGSPNKADLRNRLSIAEEDEDLSWDIEDDDEPVKA
ncbi:BSD domain-containing protein [Forsythia ovata]|uniref:BSD domain-containing protein n=1 Tax=Forsythia ovata TaxID=205694 RepID=A0ABD1T4R2_9LAMI